MHPNDFTLGQGEKYQATPREEDMGLGERQKAEKVQEKLSPDVKQGPPKHPFLTCLEEVSTRGPVPSRSVTAFPSPAPPLFT